MRKKKNSSRIKYSKSLSFEESNSLLHCLLKLLFFKVLRHINLEQVNGIPDFPGGKHGVNCCQNHSGDSNDSSFLSSAFGNACKAQGLHHYRGLRQLRRLCGSLPPAGHHLGRAQRHPPGALPPLRQLCGALPRGGRYTKGAGDRPSGNLTKGSCGLLAEEGFFFGSVNRKSIFLARPIYGFHWNMF